MDPKFQHWHDRGMSWALCVRKAITSNFSAVFFSIWLLWRSSILFPSFFTFWPFKNENIVFLFFSSSILPYVQNLRRRKCRALLVLYTKKYIYILHSEEEYGRITEFKKMFHLSFGEIGILYKYLQWRKGVISSIELALITILCLLYLLLGFVIESLRARVSANPKIITGNLIFSSS